MSKPYALLSFLWAVVIFLFSTLRVSPPEVLHFALSDKLVHFAEFAVFALLLYKAFIHSPKSAIVKHATVFCFVIAIAYGAALELLQGLLSYRECSIADFIADFAGVFVVTAYMRWEYVREKS